MKIKEMIKEMKSNDDAFNGILQKVKMGVKSDTKNIDSFMLYIILYGIGKEDWNYFNNKMNFKDIFSFTASCGEFMLQRSKFNDNVDIKDIECYEERKNVYDEKIKSTKIYMENYKRLTQNEKDDIKEICSNSSLKSKDKIEAIKKRYSSLNYEDKELKLDLLKYLRRIDEGKISLEEYASFATMLIRKPIWNDDDRVIVSMHRNSQNDLKNKYQRYFIKPFIGEKYCDNQVYNELEFSDLIEKIIANIKSNEIQKQIIEQAHKYYNSGYKVIEGGSIMKIRSYIQDELDKLIEDRNYQIIFTGAPGTGKTYNVKRYVEEKAEQQSEAGDNPKNYYKFVQFHTSYDYSDFVEGLRPVVIDGQDNNSFVRLDGIFKEFCRYIVGENSKTLNNDTSKNYYFIIDEINRADLSKVFGELMYGLEEDYRGKENHFDTQYKNLPTYKINNEGKAVLIENDCFKDGFYVPENLIIIGTMNDIDRSVETFDFALRRRFRWVEINADDVMEEALKEMRKGDSEEDIRNLIESANAMNAAISSDTKIGLNKSFHIGPAYFKKGTKENIWDTKVQPILFEYCRGRKSDDTDKFIKDCRQAFFSRKYSENNETNSEEN